MNTTNEAIKLKIQPGAELTIVYLENDGIMGAITMHILQSLPSVYGLNGILFADLFAFGETNPFRDHFRRLSFNT